MKTKSINGKKKLAILKWAYHFALKVLSKIEGSA